MPRALESLPHRVSADHPNAEYTRNLVSVGSFEAYCYFLLSLNQLRRKRVFDVKEANIMFRAAPFRCLLPYFRSVHENIEGSIPARFIAVSYDQSYRVGGIDGKVKREPLRPASPIVPLDLDRGGLFSLLVEIAFRLHLAGLRKGHGRCFQFLFPFFFRSVGLGFFLPFLRREHVPVNSVSAPWQLIEGEKID